MLQAVLLVAERRSKKKSILSEIVDAQQADKNLRTYFKLGGASSKNRYDLSVIEDTKTITEKVKIVIPFCLRKDTVAW